MLRRALCLLSLIASFPALLAARPDQTPTALTGRVSSDDEGPMEGVLVRARGMGSTISVTVVSDHQGLYSFPAGRLDPGKYNLDIRAVGYDLTRPASVEVAARKTTRADLRLEKAHDLAGQLTSAEWLLSIPGTEEQKGQLFRCAACHSLEPVVRSAYDARGWLATFARMRGYSEQSVPTHPVKLPYKVEVRPDPDFAAYLATVNLSSRPHWNYALKALRRPTGRGTRVIITEYDLPDPGRLPHDADLDDKGMVWYNDFREPLIGRLDPRTGQTKEWRFPPLKTDFPPGTLSIEFGVGGYLWIPRFRQGGITRFDSMTQRFKTWPDLPADNTDHSIEAQVAPAPDGTVWYPSGDNLKIYRLDPKTGKIVAYPMYPNYHPDQSGVIIQFSYNKKPEGHFTYGVAADSKSNAYFCDIVGGNIGRVDAKTGKVTLFKTPTLNSGPRRITIDSKDRAWFGEYYANRVGMLDTKTEQFKEWRVPSTPWVGPYPAKQDKHGDVWTAGMSTDLVLRLDPEKGQFTEYMLPTLNSNIRHIDIDNSSVSVAVWVAEVHQGKIAKIEPLD